MTGAKRTDWRDRAIAAEAERDLPAAIDFWQQALTTEPDALDIVAHIAGLSARLSQWPLAEKFYAHLIQRGQHSPAVLKAYAETLREQSRFEDAIDLLKSVLQQAPEEAGLWEALGQVLMAQGETQTALVFFNEAVRLAPDSLSASLERGCAYLENANLREALADITPCVARFKDLADQHSARFAQAIVHIALGELGEGWRHYEARHKRGTQQEIHYDIPLPRTDKLIANQKLFISSEQGLGDEVLFASLLSDIVKQAGKVGIAVEPRLIPLFERSFPEVEVIAHRTRTENGRIIRSFPDMNRADWENWAVMGDLLPQLRPDIAAFSPRPYLKASPERVGYWREWLNGLGSATKVGLLWKSLKFNAQRDRFYAPFAHYSELMANSDAVFINLQYGDCDSEQAQARAQGLNFVTPPGIDLKADLDEVAALCCALDLIIAPPNATSNIAAACGVEVWMVTPPVYWVLLGQDHAPWFAHTRQFATDKMSDWTCAFSSVAAALSERLRDRL